MAAEIVVLYEIIDASIDEEWPLDEEDREFHLISAAAAFMKIDLKRIACLRCPPLRSMSSDRTFEWPKSLRSSCSRVGSLHALENRILSRSHVDASHVTHIKIGVWSGTGFEWQMVSTFSVRIFCLGILEYLSRRTVYFGKFPFGQTKTVLPSTSQPKFPEFFGKW